MLAILLLPLALAIEPDTAAPEPPAWVVGGSPVAEGDWPDTAGIVLGGSVQCTGTLIHPRLVLTAGHCAGGISAVILDTNDYEDPGERIRVSKETEYPYSWGTYDVTILELEQEAETLPRPLALDCIIEDELYDGAAVAIVGYGATNESATRYGTRLMEAYTTIGDHDCDDLSRGCWDAVSPDGELIAGGDGIDSCNGDSGGPLYLLTDEGEYLVGVTSRYAEPASQACGDGGIYVRVDAVADWIEDETGYTLDRPDCEPNLPPVPLVEPIEVFRGSFQTATVSPNDPNEDDTHDFAVLEDGLLGTATVDEDGVITYTAGDATGEDSVEIGVTDSHGDSATARLAVSVIERPVKPGEGCECSQSSATPVWLALWMPAWWCRRRRS